MTTPDPAQPDLFTAPAPPALTADALDALPFDELLALCGSPDLTDAERDMVSDALVARF